MSLYLNKLTWYWEDIHAMVAEIEMYMQSIHVWKLFVDREIQKIEVQLSSRKRVENSTNLCLSSLIGAASAAIASKSNSLNRYQIQH